MQKTFFNLVAGTVLLGAPAWSQQLTPQPNAQVSSTAQPLIQAIFNLPLRAAKLWIDGQEASDGARVEGTKITFTPAYPLSVGVHQIVTEGVNYFGQPQRASWSFSIAAPLTNTMTDPNPASPSSVSPPPGAVADIPRPELSAEFPESIRTGHILVDGQDLAQQTFVFNGRVSAVPSFDLLSGQHSAQVSAVGLSGQHYEGSWNFASGVVSAGVDPANPSPLLNLFPAPGAIVPDTQTPVSADFPVPARNFRLFVDQTDYSRQVQSSGLHLTWSPPYNQPLAPGPHTVSVEGIAMNGQPLNGNWDFVVDPNAAPTYPIQNPPTTAYPPSQTYPQPNLPQNYPPQNQPQTYPPQNQPINDPTQMLPAEGPGELSIQAPVSGDLVDSSFQIQGTTRPNAIVRITVHPDDPNARGYDYKAQANASGAFVVPVNAAWAAPGANLRVEVVAVEGVSGLRVAETYGFQVTRR